MAENFRIKVGVSFTIEDYTDKMHTGGDVNTNGMRLRYNNGDGISFVAGQILYTEGAIGGPVDFFEIKNQNDITLGTTGYLSITLSVQTNVAPGTVINRTISIAGSLPFVFSIQYQ